MATRSFSVWLACSLLVAATSAQSTKLNGELTQPVGGNVTYNWLVTPDGSRAVYQADQDVDEDYEVYSVPMDGGGPSVRLSGPEGDVPYYPAFELSPDGAFVAYYAGIGTYFVPVDGSTSAIQLDTPPPGASMGDTDPFFRLASNDWLVFWNEGEGGLWSAPTDGGNGVLLSGAASYAAGDFVISPDGTRVYFRSNLSLTGLDLYAMNVDGSGTAIPFGGADQFRLTPDGTRLVYRDDRDTASVYELYSVPSDGSGSPVKLSGVLPAGADVSFVFDISPDGRRVVFGVQESDRTELYSVPVDGSAAPRRISGAMTAGGHAIHFSISPDSRRVVYLADQEVDGELELYSVLIDRFRGRFKLNGPLVAGGDVSYRFEITPDSRRVVFRADKNIDEHFELYSASIDQNSRPRLRPVDLIPVSKLNGPLIANGDVELVFELSQDGSRVLFRADANVDQQIELFSVPVDGSEPATRLNDQLVPGAAVYDFHPGTDRVAFRAPQGSPFDGAGLFSTRIDGLDDPVMLTPPMPLGPVVGDVHAFHISLDGSRTVYLADQETESVDELYSVPTRGGATPIKLNGPLVPGGDVGAASPNADAFLITGDGQYVVYMANEEAFALRELYRVPILGGEAPLKLVAGGGVYSGFRESPDGVWIVYRDSDSPGETALYSVRLDGSQAPVELSGPLVENGAVASFQISPDATRVVYRSDEDQDGRFELFSVPIDGSAPAVRLHFALPGGRRVTDYAISPDGRTVVYLVDDEQNDLYDCYSVPIDRSGTPIRLNDVFNTERDVTAFRIDSDSYHVVFVGDCTTDDVFEIYSVHIRRVSGPVRLNPTPVAGGDVGAFLGRSFAISPNARRVVYIADQETDGLLELFSVSIDGAPAAVKLNGPLVAGGAVEAFEISPNSRRVVFFANQPVLGPRLLYAVPIAGSRPALTLSGTPATNGYIRSFAIGPGGQVLYVAEQDTQNVRELYRVPIAGNHEPEKLNGPIVGTHNQMFFTVSPRGNRVVYRADQEIPYAIELFSSRLSKQPLGQAEPTEFVQR